MFSLSLSSLNPQQREAVQTIRGPVLILAGAGTGKTRVITFRIAHMIEGGIAPEHILGVTFTNKAAREMQERVRKLMPRARAGQARTQSQNQTMHGQRQIEAPAQSHGSGASASADSEVDSAPGPAPAPVPVEEKKPQQPTICTFHSLCVRILRQHIDKLGYKRNFVIYDESEQLSAVKKILSHISSKAQKLDAGDILGALSRLKNAGRRAAASGDDLNQAMAAHIRPKYESALRACNAVDFDDLILLTLRLFSEFPDALESCRAKYQYVMVDEYQDTNEAQFRLVHALTQKHRNLCVVGDDDQSIYGWRGAEIANLLEMETHYPEVKVIRLEQNYRSTNTILNAANAVIKRNVRRRGKNLWSQNGDGQKIALYTFASEEEEAESIVERIEYARHSRTAKWGEHAVLFRTNAQSRPIETALRQNRVQYHLIGGQSFFDRREIRDFLAFVKTLLNPDDDISLLRIANVPARGLSDASMERLLGASHERKCSVFAVMKNPAVTTALPGKARESVESFVHLIEHTRAPLLATDSGGVFLQSWADRFLDHIGYFQELRRFEKTPEGAEGRIRNLKELMATLDGDGSAGQRPFERLETFLEEITLESDREDEEAPEDAVTLITMHSCKGLEFPHVYVVGLEEGLLPHARAKEEGTLDEERRLFYVAITRAMRTLSISHCGSRNKFGSKIICHPSSFLKELPEELVEHADQKAKTPVAAGTVSAKSMFDTVRSAIG
jgi:DNA helicase-2/ATP-dependent DNA helicase PcrA